MRKVFLFWGIILFILILGITAIIYGKMLLKEEKEKENRIIMELILPEVPG